MHVQGTEELRSEINITPLVDVVLVLLVIFMVVTPLLKQEIPLELPVAEKSRGAKEAVRVTLSLAADGTAYLDGEALPQGAIAERLRPIYAARTDKTIFLEADGSLPYRQVVEAMDACRAAGVSTIGAVTRRERSQAE